MAKMECHIISALALITACISLSMAVPLHDHDDVSMINPKSLILGEAMVTSNKLHISPKALKLGEPMLAEENIHLNQHKETKKNEKTEKPPAPPVVDESDYFFLPEKFPDLPNDEFLEIDEDATPFDFLKQNNIQSADKNHTNSQSLNPTTNATNAIYVTVPIFINTANGGYPLSLSVGGQPIPINTNNKPIEKANKLKPTSEFNKLAIKPHPTRRPVLPQRSINRRRGFGMQGRSRGHNRRNPFRNANRYDTYILYY